MLPVAIYSEILEGAKREIQVYVCVCVRIIAMIIFCHYYYYYLLMWVKQS